MESKASSSGLTILNTRANFVITILKVLGPTRGQTNALTQVSGAIIRCTERAYLCGQIAEKFIEESIGKIRNMGMVK
jgi:hypothetical protein